MTILVITGVAGRLGNFVTKELSEAGAVARHPARSPGRAPKLTGVIVKKCGYKYSGETITTLSGIDVLFMISAKENPERLRQHRVFIDATKAVGVKYTAYTSLYNASPGSTFTLAHNRTTTE